MLADRASGRGGGATVQQGSGPISLYARMVSDDGPIWPEADIAALRQQDSFRMGAAVCRRGHVLTDQLRPDRLEDTVVTPRCKECGGRVLTACPTCRRRIAGDLFVPGVIAFATPDAPSFCDGCGAAFPWASRDERIMELENALDEEGVADADLAIIRVQLDLLRLGDASEKDERTSWQTIKARAGAVFMNERVQNLVFSLVNTAVRHELGLPPA